MCSKNKTKRKNIKQSIRTPFLQGDLDVKGRFALEIKKLATKVGYTACGITSTEPFDEFGVVIEERIRRFPEAIHLYAPLRKRVDSCSSAAWAKSIIVCVRRYGKYEIPAGLTGYIGRNYLVDKRYQECPDHKMLKKMTDGLMRMGIRVHKDGVPDRWAGARAGVTRFGRNCFAYSAHGSWINIETWLVNADLPTDKPTLETPCPENCRACIDACPTKALLEPFVMRMDRCIAYLTYSAPEPIRAELWGKMGAWIYGCDVCQEVCPLNNGAWEPIEKAPWLEEVVSSLRPKLLAKMDENTYRTVVHPLFWYIPMENLARWHANAERALLRGSDLT